MSQFISIAIVFLYLASPAIVLNAFLAKVNATEEVQKDPHRASGRAYEPPTTGNPPTGRHGTNRRLTTH